MNNRILTLNLTATVAAFLFSISAFGQFWTEDFGNDGTPCSSAGDMLSGYSSANGNWSSNETGTNGNAANAWFVSSQEASQNPGSCSATCTNGPFVDKTLHIGTTTFGPTDAGATYLDISGFPTGTDKRAESPTIDCTGFSNIEVSFNYIQLGHGEGDDYCTLDYFDGTSWQELQVIPITSQTSCAPGTQWDSFAATLPASADGNPGVKIGFRWRNDGGGNSTSKSVALDQINLTEQQDVPPEAMFTVDTDTICPGECVQFTDESTGTGIESWQWTFDGGTPDSYDGQTPPTVCYSSEGQFNVTLQVTSENGLGDDLTEEEFITVENCSTGPTLIFSPSQTVICEGDCIDLTNNSTGENIQGYNWTFQGADTETSTEDAPSNICWSLPGNYDITLEATDDNGTSESTISIEVQDCITGPDVDFSASQTQICPGQCVDFFDESTTTDTITSYSWVFSGSSNTTSSTAQNPTNICYDEEGTYTVSLTATDGEGETELVESGYISVEDCGGAPIVNFTADDTVICTGDCVIFTNQTLGEATEVEWTFAGAQTPGSDSFSPGPICYNEPGSYDVSLVINNAQGNDALVVQNYITVENCINPPVPRYSVSEDTICAGECVSFTDESTGLGVGNWQWFFPGADNTTTSISQNPDNICYSVPGSYNVSLSISGTGGDADTTFTDVVTVEATAECRPNIDSLMFNRLICKGLCTSFDAEVTNADSVKWTFPGGMPEESEMLETGQVCWDSTGQFQVTLESYNASGITTYKDTITVENAPALDAGPDRIINSGATVTLTASTNGAEGEFEWQPFEQVSDFRAREVTTSPLENTFYIVSFNTPGGCTVTDTVLVRVNFVATVGVPSSFSPNEDGNNDLLKVYGQGIAQMDFRVFNRYGEQIFQTDKKSRGWDGTYHSSDLNTGVYTYSLEILFTDGRFETYSGQVNLVR